MTVLVVDHDESRLAISCEELDGAFGPGMKPASMLIAMPRLALDDMLFEVETVPALP